MSSWGKKYTTILYWQLNWENSSGGFDMTTTPSDVGLHKTKITAWYRKWESRAPVMTIFYFQLKYSTWEFQAFQLIFLLWIDHLPHVCWRTLLWKLILNNSWFFYCDISETHFLSILSIYIYICTYLYFPKYHNTLFFICLIFTSQIVFYFWSSINVLSSINLFSTLSFEHIVSVLTWNWGCWNIAIQIPNQRYAL